MERRDDLRFRRGVRDEFGSSVSLSGDRALVGAYGDDLFRRKLHDDPPRSFTNPSGFLASLGDASCALTVPAGKPRARSAGRSGSPQ